MKLPGLLPRMLLALVLPAAIALAVGGLMRTFDDPVDRGGQATAMAWADRVFVSKEQFADWLEAHGGSYEAWVERHPGVSPWEATGPVEAAYTPPSGEESAGSSLPLPSSTQVLVTLLALVGLGLLAMSALPPALLFARRSPSRHVGVLVIDRRPEFAAAGLSLLVGAGLPVLLA